MTRVKVVAEPVRTGRGGRDDAAGARLSAHADERPALVDGTSSRTVSYADLAARVDSVAAGLAARGFRPGDGLAVWAPNQPAWACFAPRRDGRRWLVTGINPLATDREAATQITDARTTILATTSDLAPRARTLPGLREVLVLDDTPPRTPPRGLGAAPAVDPEAIALLPYSSGTTGLPKGVVLTHANLVTSVRQLGRHLRPTRRDVALALAPFSHVMGFVVTCALPLAAGATVVTMARFDLEACWRSSSGTG